MSYAYRRDVLRQYEIWLETEPARAHPAQARCGARARAVGRAAN
jgi:hypothetical protein